MATNTPASYGRDIRCVNDADELWSEAEGVEIIFQDAIHVLTCDDFLGPKGDGRGFDVGKLIGKRQAELTSYGHILTEVLTRDERILTADVTLTEKKNAAGMIDCELAVSCMTAQGPFGFVKFASELTVSDFGSQS